MRIRLYDVTRITRTGLVPHSAIDAEDGAITAVYDTLPAEEPGVRSVDAKGAYAAPGFIDIHLHGGGGVEFMDATPERLRGSCPSRHHHAAAHHASRITGTDAAHDPRGTAGTGRHNGMHHRGRPPGRPVPFARAKRGSKPGRAVPAHAGAVGQAAGRMARRRAYHGRSARAARRNGLGRGAAGPRRRGEHRPFGR